MTQPAPRLPSRRAVLAGGGLLALAGCLPGGEPPAGSGDPPEVRLRARVASEVERLVARYEAVLARHPALRGELSTLAAEHTVHAEALRGPDGTTARARPTVSGPPVPDTVAAARTELAAAERDASDRRARQAVGAAPGTARLLASIAASEAAHAHLLDPEQE